MSNKELLPTEWALVKGIQAGGLLGPVRWADRAGPVLMMAFLLLGFPLLAMSGTVEPAMIGQLGRYCCLAVLAVGLDLVWGYTGILSLCQALFFTLGGYAMGMHLAMHGPVAANGVPTCIAYVSSSVGGMTLPWFWAPFSSVWFAVFAVVAIPGLFAFVFGFFSFRSRVKGVYFSIITQAVTVAMCTLFGLNLLQLGGTNGLTNFTHLLTLPLSDSGSKLLMYEASAMLLVLSVLFAKWLTATRFGRLLVAVRDSESRLRFAGYQPVWFKTAVFTVGAMLGGLAGALYAPQTGIITPSDMQAAQSLLVVVWVAVGGRGTIIGAVIGALLINLLYAQLTSTWPKLWPFMLGALFVSVVLFLPDGLVGAWRRMMAKFDGKELQ